MNTQQRAQENLDNFLVNPFLTLFSRPLLSNPVPEELLRIRQIPNPDSRERSMTSTARQARVPVEEHITQLGEIYARHNVIDGNEISFVHLQGQPPPGILDPFLLSVMEYITNLDEEVGKGLPKEMIDKIKRMKMGKSCQDCSVCSDSFKRGEKIRKLPCKHIFHDKCLMPWLEQNSTCPNCRFNLLEFFTENPDGEYD